jgi:adenine-specific DNA-methyltransferase
VTVRPRKHLASQEYLPSTVGTQLRLDLPECGEEERGEGDRRAENGILCAPSMPSVKAACRSQKEMGAYYTDERVAGFLVRWAVVTGRETVLDPSFGGGVFLKAAAERISDLGGDPDRQILGVEIDDRAHEAFASHRITAKPLARLLHADFFKVTSDDLPPVDAVVGNPPYIRYHRFVGEARRAALRCAQAAGVTISQLTSSWAPFLVHAVQFLKSGGRLAMVVPAELLHAAYAKPVLVYLARSFRDVRVLTFTQRLFSELSEDTILLLAEGKGEMLGSFSLLNLAGSPALSNYAEPSLNLPAGTRIDNLALGQVRESAGHYLLPESIRELYRQLRTSPMVAQLGELADVGIGYVTGDNEFFHLSRGTVASYGLPPSVLMPAARHGSDLRGLSFTCRDWQALNEFGCANMLLSIPNGVPLPDSVRVYLAEGVKRGVPNRYKCRARRDWYRVPHVYQGDAFLTYMSGSVPKLVANEARAVSPNTLLVVRFRPPGLRSPPDAVSLAVAWQTSLTALSCELEGHSLGGGMLKLEPSEARRVVVAVPHIQAEALQGLADEIDGLLRSGKAEVARERGDAIILRGVLGLSEDDVRRLREGWHTLRTRRLSR